MSDNMNTPRKQALIDAAKTRALIIAHVNNTKDSLPVTPDQLLAHIKLQGLDYSMSRMMSLIDRMCSSKLLTRTNIEHPDYKFGYLPGKITEDPKSKILMEAETGIQSRKVQKTGSSNTELPLDIRINEKNQTLTIRAMGLRITIGKEK